MPLLTSILADFLGGCSLCFTLDRRYPASEVAVLVGGGLAGLMSLFWFGLAQEPGVGAAALFASGLLGAHVVEELAYRHRPYDGPKSVWTRVGVSALVQGTRVVPRLLGVAVGAVVGAAI